MKNDLETVIRLYDPAFEALAWDDLRAYAVSRDAEDLPALPPGASPVVFHFRRLSRAQVKWVEGGENDDERFSRAFLAGVEKISGGRFGDGWLPARPPKSLAMSEDELGDQQISRLDEKEIGQWIYRRSIVPFDCSVPSLLLPTSLAAFDGNARRCAERTRRDAPPSSLPPKDG